MKRTEKIEIRLSNEEKTALTDLAEKEGRTVSKLVRDVVSKYMELNTARLPQKFTRWKLGAISAGAAILGFGFANALSVVGNSELYTLSGHIDYQSFSSPLHRKAKKPQKIQLQAKGKTFEIETSFDTSGDLSQLKIYVCEKTESGCNAVATENLRLHPTKRTLQASQNEHAEWSFSLEGPNY